MPFTFSHPALAVPFYLAKKRWFSLTGLVAGSIAPDFAYFIQMKKTGGRFSHTLTGVFLFDLPMAIFLALVFHNIIKRPLVNHLPRPFYRRFGPYAQGHWTGFNERAMVIVLSILIGAGTHLLWDAVTHSTMDWEGIKSIESDLMGYHLTANAYRIIHIVNSIIGLMFLGWLAWRMPQHRMPRRTGRSWLYWPAIAMVALIIVMVRIWLGPHAGKDDLIVISIAACLLALTIVSVFYWEKGRSSGVDFLTNWYA
jgi:hypothetical protein